MFLGGNQLCNEFLSKYNVSKLISIPVKYNTPAAKLYKQRISAAVEGRELPTELPESISQSNSSSSLESSTTTSTEPLKNETEEEYITRQRRLQEEARERLKQKFGSSSGLKSSGKMQVSVVM